MSKRLTTKHETKTLGSTSRMKAEFGAWRVSYRAKAATKACAKSCTNKVCQAHKALRHGGDVETVERVTLSARASTKPVSRYVCNSDNKAPIQISCPPPSLYQAAT